MSVRKILLSSSAALVVAAGAFLAMRSGVAPTADAAPAISAVAAATPPAAITVTPFHYGSTGPVTIYRRTPEPARFVILISDEHGWTSADADQARRLSAEDATVVGVDLPHYLAAAQREAGPHGLYPAGDFSELAQAAQKALKFSNYHRPILVGQGAGAALAYGTLAQSPSGIFQGGAVLGFRADLKTARPLLAGDGGLIHATAPGGFAYAPDPKLATPFIAIQDAKPDVVRAFVAKLPQGHVLPVVANAPLEPQLASALAMIEPTTVAPTISAARLANLPLVETPATGGGDTLAIFYSGDGGWAGIDRGLAQGFVKAGVPVVGYDSLRYFWTQRSPQAAADDLAAVIRHYQAAWGRKRVILAGYSFGADALPIIVQHLPADLREQVRMVALLGTGSTGELEFHPGDWLDLGAAKDSYPIAPVLSSLQGLPIVCIYGTQEHDDACPAFPANVRKVELPGDHHFNGDYDAVGRALVDAAGLKST